MRLFLAQRIQGINVSFGVEVMTINEKGITGEKIWGVQNGKGQNIATIQFANGAKAFCLLRRQEEGNPS